MEVGNNVLVIAALAIIGFVFIVVVAHMVFAHSKHILFGRHESVDCRCPDCDALLKYDIDGASNNIEGYYCPGCQYVRCSEKKVKQSAR